jgi:hypothetical protein
MIPFFVCALAGGLAVAATLHRHERRNHAPAVQHYLRNHPWLQKKYRFR